MNQFQHYLLDEFVEDYKTGEMSRRDFVMKVIGVSGGQFATASALTSAVGPTGTATSGGAGGVPGVSGATSGGDPSIQQVMSQDADQNLYYLKLQEQMSAESRSYSAISNVLKARHDTMKNAIGNVR